MSNTVECMYAGVYLDINKRLRTLDLDTWIVPGQYFTNCILDYQIVIINEGFTVLALGPGFRPIIIIINEG